MEKCIMCLKEIYDTTEKFCHSCIEFFKWKYNKDYYRKMKRFERILKSHVTKLNTGGKK
jgi:hypothetical protein